MTDLSALIERAENLTGPDRQFDMALAWATGWDATDRAGGSWRETYEQCRDRWAEEENNRPADNWGVPRFTASLDAIVALVKKVLPGCEQHISWPSRVDQLNGFFEVSSRIRFGDIEVEAFAPTAAVALCLALLRALHQEKADG